MKSSKYNIDTLLSGDSNLNCHITAFEFSKPSNQWSNFTLRPIDSSLKAKTTQRKLKQNDKQQLKTVACLKTKKLKRGMGMREAGHANNNDEVSRINKKFEAYAKKANIS